MSMQLVKEKQDLTHLSWSVFCNSPGTSRSFLKSYSELGERKRYYKLSNFDNFHVVVGHECVNERIVDCRPIANCFGHFPLIVSTDSCRCTCRWKIQEVYLCASEEFKMPGESKIALDAYQKLEGFSEECALDFCIRMGWETYV